MLSIAMILLQDARFRSQQMRRDERGASVLEWALIAAVVVVAATIIGTVILNIVREKGNTLEECSQAGATC